MQNAVRPRPALAPWPIRLAAPVLLAIFAVVAHETSVLAEVGVVAAAAGVALVATALAPVPAPARERLRHPDRTRARADATASPRLVRLRH